MKTLITALALAVAIAAAITAAADAMPAARKGEPAAGKVDRDTCASWPAVRVSLRVAPSGACTAGGDTGGWGTQWSFKRGVGAVCGRVQSYFRLRQRSRLRR
jgi:hypothetical protein